MTVKLWQVQVQGQQRSGQEVDYPTNVFHFRTEGTAALTVERDAIHSALGTFYTAIRTYLASTWEGSLIEKFYVRDSSFDAPDSATYTAGPWGPPVATLTQTITGGVPTTQGALPCEVAAALSFHGDYTSVAEYGPDVDSDGWPDSRPRARYRGRLYIGPLGSGVLTTDGTTFKPTLTSTFRNALVAAGTALMGATTVKWSTHSRTDRRFDTVVGGWVDDAFDTQRRRGPAPTVKTTF